MTNEGTEKHRSRHLLLVGLISALWTLIGSNLVWAHSGDAITQEIFGFENGADWLVRTNFGIITSDAPNEFVCEEAFLGGDFFLIAPLSSIHWATFSENSIHLTTDGCSFERVMELDETPTDTDAHIGSGRIAFATNSPTDSGIWWSQGGETFERIPTDPALFAITGIAFLTADKVVATSYRNDSSRAADLHVFDLEAGSFETIELPEEDELSFPYLMAGQEGEFVWLVRRKLPMSSPPEYERVVFWGTLANPKRFAYITQYWPTGASISPDLQSVAISGISEGFGMAEGQRVEEDVSWTIRAEQTTANCVGHIGPALHLCTRRIVDNADAVTLLDEAVEPLVDFRDLEGPKSECESGSETALVCPLIWPEVAKSIRINVDADAGMPDLGDDHDAGHPIDTGDLSDPTGCGACAIGSKDPVPGPLFFLCFALVIRIQQRRRC